jgi:hypothetical protein
MAFSQLSIRFTERNRAFEIAVELKIRILPDRQQAQLCA